MRVIDFFDRSAGLFPARPCVSDADGNLTYAEVAEASHRIAGALRAAGLAAEAKVGILAPNVPVALVAIVGILRSGCAWLPVNGRNAVADNVAILRQNDCEWLFYHSDYEAEAAALADSVTGLRGLVCLDRPGRLGPALADWSAGQPVPAPDPGTGRDHVFKLALSGGTTGTPKGVMHTNLNGQVMIASLLITFPHEQVPVFLCPAPITHAAGNLCLWILAAGGRIVLMRKADALEILQNVERWRATTLFAPPTVIYALLAHPRVGDFDYRSLEYFFYGAAPMSTEKLKRAIEVFGPCMAQIYSQAEATMALTFLTPRDHLVIGDPQKEGRLRSAGRPGPLVRLEIMDDDGRLLPPGEVGEIVVKSDLVCKGYYKRSEETAAGRRDGWLLTSDCGFRDVEGYIHLVDRKRDMIITGGFNVYPSEVEQVIGEMPGVHDCAVVGVPDEKWGEAIKAVIAPEAGATLDPEAVIALCKARLGSVKAPKSVDLWPELPKSPNGKVLKRAIRESYWQGRDRRLTV